MTVGITGRLWLSVYSISNLEIQRLSCYVLVLVVERDILWSVQRFFTMGLYKLTWSAVLPGALSSWVWDKDELLHAIVLP